MNTETGEIIALAEDELLTVSKKQRETLVLLSEEQYIILSGMNRLQRRAYYKKNHKQFGWESWEQINSELKKPRKA